MFQRYCAKSARSISLLTSRSLFTGQSTASYRRAATTSRFVSFSHLNNQYHRSSLLLPILLLVGGRGSSGGGGGLPPFGSINRHSFSFSSAFTVGASQTQHDPFSVHNKRSHGGSQVSNMFRRGRTDTSSSTNSNTPQSGMLGRRRAQSDPAVDASPQSNSPDELPTKWDSLGDITSHLQKCVPSLSSSCHKGSSGRVGVLGGSARYTGAPYYAAMAALRTGADLAFVFCAEEAAVPIKCYSPELMVASVYNGKEFDSLVSEEQRLNGEVARIKAHELERVASMESVSLDAGENGDETKEDVVAKLDQVKEEQERAIDDMVSSVTETFDRLHVLIVGPGLGRCPLVLRAAAKIIEAAKEKKIPMVIDADGLYLLTLKEYSDLVAGYKGLVLTPNAVEVKRLTQSMSSTEDDSSGVEEIPGSPVGSPGKRRSAWADSPEKAVSEMSAFERATEGVVIVKKGAMDVIFSTSFEALDVKRESMLCEEQGGLKRSGGIGDILSGCIGTFVAWNRILSELRKRDTQHGDTKDYVEASSGINDLMLGCWSACCVTKRATKHAFEKKRRGMTAPDILEELARTVDEMTGDSIVVDDEK
mmetsp:Transcript_7772/g.17391  ORF Transcript_7772/g.17391 Transcript_7772/m.17391 type:complete len:591 (-) Transcript_7772:9-1781(-)